jgi:uncharacterized membrane protein YbjE (DUF340 family)
MKNSSNLEIRLPIQLLIFLVFLFVGFGFNFIDNFVKGISDALLLNLLNSIAGITLRKFKTIVNQEKLCSNNQFFDLICQ